MELPDFDTLKHWALAEPERLDELLHQQIDALIEQVGPDRQRRLRGLQFRIDCQRRLAKNNLDSCIRIANMMHESFFTMRSQLNHLNDEPPFGGGNMLSGNNIVRLSEHRRDK
ncbi:DUF3135 domain-containing protein [Aeromonas sp. MR16]|uniref:DUF3135 domain-containing protein n=1 Tax=Aeromonas sp. MR16 TaxID=2923420 RepID=UPI001F4BBCFC|nr:DUF3135 domain-containing protein [Aeromonas sp. MR16]MCH7372696.1 DUF3135 domain-containing protein [Aeromonas sp. MR16]